MVEKRTLDIPVAQAPTQRIAPRPTGRTRMLREAARADQQAAQQAEPEVVTAELPVIEPDAAPETITAQREMPRQPRVEVAAERTPRQVSRAAHAPSAPKEGAAPRKQRRRFHRERFMADVQVKWEARRGNPVAKLRDGSAKAEASYMKSLKKSGIVSGKMTAPEQRAEMSELHKAYAAMMAMQMVTPLQRGLSAQNVMTTVGMGSTMFLLSPNFRELAGDYAQDVKNGIQKFAGNRAQRKLDNLQDKKGDKALTSRRGKKWQKRIDRYDKMQRGHREPFTERSAALTEVGLAESAYWEMRKPGVDVEAVQEKYQTALTQLYQYVEDDGLDAAEVSRNMRTIVGQRMEREPELASVFAEMGQGRFVKAEPKEVYMAGSGQKVTAWTGDYYDVTSGNTVTAGSFSLREPQTADQHMHRMAEAMWGDMADAKSVGEFNEVIDSFMVGAAVQNDPATVDLIEDDDKRVRLERVRTMFASMKADGIDPAEQHRVYQTAVISSVTEAQSRDPELAAAWNKEYGGAQWAVRMSDQMKEFTELGQAAGNRPSREDLSDAFGELVDDETVEASLDEEAAAESGVVPSDTHVPDAQPQAEQQRGFWDSVTGRRVRQVRTVLRDHLSGSLETGGPVAFDQALQHASLDHVGQNSLFTKQVQQWRKDVQRDTGLNHQDTEMVDLLYDHSLGEVVGQMAKQHPEMTAHMEANYGPQWRFEHQERIVQPDAFIPPTLPEGADDATRERILVNSMSSPMVGDAGRSAAAVTGLFPSTKRKRRAGAVMMSLQEYATGEPASPVEDREFSLRQARRDQMFTTMQASGITDPEAQRELYATAVTHAAERVADSSTLGKHAVYSVYGQGNWQQKAFQKTLGKDAAEASYEMYDERKLRLGLTGSQTDIHRAQEQLVSGLDRTKPAEHAQEINLTRHKQQARRRDNLFHNELEVQTGRWAEQSVERAAGPELG